MTTIKLTPSPVNAGTRLGSMILDHFVMTMIAMVFFVPMMIKGFSSAFTVSHDPDVMNFDGPLLYVALLGFTLYFCKDVVNGRSIGKRATKTQVVNNITGEVASPVRCFVRNVFCVIWPVEVIVTLANPSRRLGDLVAGTKVVAYDPVNVEQPIFSFKKALLPLALAYGLLLLFTLSLQGMRPSLASAKYVESSYNEAESKALEKLFNDRLGTKLEASVKVFDKIEQQQLKYISVIYLLKRNYLEDEDASNQLEEITEQLLYSQYPKESFTGRSKFVFKAAGNMRTLSKPIGTTIVDVKK